MCGGGGIGGILGDIGGGLLGAFLGPEIGIPVALAAGAGSAIGSTAAGVASGEPFGQAITGGLEAGALSGITSGVGELAAGQGFFGTASPFSGLFGGGTTPAATGDILSGVSAADVNSVVPVLTGTGVAPSSLGATAGNILPAPTAGINVAPMGAAPAGATGGGGAPIGGIGSSTGSFPPNIGGALPTPPTITQGIGDFGPGGAIGPAGETGPIGSTITGGAGGDVPGAALQPDMGAVGTQDFTSAGGSSGIMNYLSQNPGLLLAGGGLLMSMMMNNNIPYTPQLQHAAATGTLTGNQLIGMGEQNANALTTGLLPPGAQAAIDQATAAAEATTKSNFASLGLSGSTMMDQAIAGIQQNAAAQKFADLSQVSQLGLQQIGAGQNAINEANQVYGNIMNTTLQQDFLTQMAIANLAAALAGSTRGISTG